jgi:hypothetical protein
LLCAALLLVLLPPAAVFPDDAIWLRQILLSLPLRAQKTTPFAAPLGWRLTGQDGENKPK